MALACLRAVYTISVEGDDMRVTRGAEKNKELKEQDRVGQTDQPESNITVELFIVLSNMEEHAGNSKYNTAVHGAEVFIEKVLEWRSQSEEEIESNQNFEHIIFTGNLIFLNEIHNSDNVPFIEKTL